MSLNAYNEQSLVEEPAIRLFAELGWHIACGNPHPQPFSHRETGCETWVDEAGLFGRETRGEVVLVSRLRNSLTKLNPTIPTETINAAVDELTRDRSAMSLPAANREIYDFLKNGIKVSTPEPEETPSPQSSPSGRGSSEKYMDSSPAIVPKGDGSLFSPSTSGRGKQGEGLTRGGGQQLARVRVIDWEHPESNDFLLVSQFSVTGALYTCRPDLVGFVNGLPMVVIELKKPGVPARAAFDENLTHYKQQIPSLFWYNALLIASNGTDSRVGSLTADWGRFFEWKRVESENEPRRVSLETMLRGTCDRTRLLDIVENFTLFSEHKSGLAKIIGQNHQVLGVNATIASLLRVRLANPDTLTPPPLPCSAPSPQPLPEGEEPGEGGKTANYRGGLQYSGLVDRARQLRGQQTSGEEFVWELLRGRHFEGLKFRRQHQICDYIADFYCDEQKLVIELDGNVHASPEVGAKDSKRDAYLHSLGYTVLRFPNDYVINDPEGFLLQISHTIKLPSTSGRGKKGEGNTPNPNGIGVFWQTQGSGKSFSMVFFAQKVLRKVAGNWNFVVVTDRVELDDQISKTFKATGAVSEAEGDQCHATSGAHLRELLRGNHRYIFSLIHKFQPERVMSEKPSPLAP